MNPEINDENFFALDNSYEKHFKRPLEKDSSRSSNFLRRPEKRILFSSSLSSTPLQDQTNNTHNLQIDTNVQFNQVDNFLLNNQQPTQPLLLFINTDQEQNVYSYDIVPDSNTHFIQKTDINNYNTMNNLNCTTQENYINNALLAIIEDEKNKENTELKCLVCEDKSTGIHFGINSCDGCKVANLKTKFINSV